MNEYINRIPEIEKEISILDMQVRFLKSIVIKRKPDGSDYKKKSNQCDLVIHDKTSYHNWYYINLPTSEEFFLQDPRSQYCNHCKRYFLSDEFDSLEHELNSLILSKEKEISAKRATIKKLLFLNDYLNQYLTVKRVYLSMIETAREEIQNAIEEIHPEYSTLPIGNKPVSEIWDDLRHFDYSE